jgi:hypothetical protein
MARQKKITYKQASKVQITTPCLWMMPHPPPLQMIWVCKHPCKVTTSCLWLMQATLRMRGDGAVSANAVDASLGNAAQYLITASKSATVVALTRPVSQVGKF